MFEPSWGLNNLCKGRSPAQSYSPERYDSVAEAFAINHLLAGILGRYYQAVVAARMFGGPHQIANSSVFSFGSQRFTTPNPRSDQCTAWRQALRERASETRKSRLSSYDRASYPLPG